MFVFSIHFWSQSIYDPHYRLYMDVCLPECFISYYKYQYQIVNIIVCLEDFLRCVCYLGETEI